MTRHDCLGFNLILCLQIGEMLCSKEAQVALPTIKVQQLDVVTLYHVTNPLWLLSSPCLQIGETLCSKEAPVALPTIKVEEPTVSMTFKVGSRI